MKRKVATAAEAETAAKEKAKAAAELRRPFSKNKKGVTAQSSFTVMDYEGHVVGIVGGVGEKKGNRGLNRATSSPRQPGSSIKPITVYSLALDQNIISYSYYRLSVELLNKYGFKNLNLVNKYSKEDLLEYMKMDKKATSDKITFIVPYDKKKVKSMSFESEEVLKML